MLRELPNVNLQTRKRLLVQVHVEKRAFLEESTKQGNKNVARDMASAHRTALAKGEVGIREKKPAPALKDFLKGEFLPFAQTRHAAEPLFYRHYK